VNPSSGNLHPTEAYLVRDRVQHYAPYLHAFETLGTAEQPIEMLVALTSVHWREAWKYGERAYRYCQHDAGHAIAALAFSAAALGWKTRIVEAADRQIASLLGIDRQSGVEAEHPDVLLSIGPNARFEKLESFESQVSGTPNRLSRETVQWDVIDDVNLACTIEDAPQPVEHLVSSIGEPPMRDISAHRIFRTRRSAVDLDGETRIDAATFFRMMQRAMPGRVPFSTIWWRPAIHLALFVHRVDGVAPGVYLLVREPSAEAELRRAFDPSFDWIRPDGCPPDLPLYLLGEGDVRRVAGLVCCQQAIAADGAFAVAMLGDLSRLVADGAWLYRRLHFEAGMIGQVLYLEAEAVGRNFRGTGIGCFFDDLISQALKIQSSDLTAIYCFTAGGAVDDPRIQSHPPYDHLR
jgi:nitroreductase